MDDVPPLGDALPLVATDPRWLEVALADLDAVHADHLHCERKAAQSALSLIRSYPERTRPRRRRWRGSPTTRPATSSRSRS